VRRAALVALVLAPALAGCETTQEKSAQLERAALRERKATVAAAGLRIAHPNTRVRVVSETLLHGSEGAAAAVTVRNESARGLRSVPIAIEARDRSGAVVYSNTAGGVAASLTQISYLPPRATFTWVDDQVQGATASSLSVKVGEAQPASGRVPALAVSGVKRFEDPANGPGAEGTVSNRSTLEQHELALYVVARRGGTVTAAGRAVVPLLAPGQSTRFQAFFVGNPQGGTIEVQAPPSTLP
jgi:hypothetical protein